MTQARSLPPGCDVYTGTRTQHRKHAARGLGLLFHSLGAFLLNAIKRNQGNDMDVTWHGMACAPEGNRPKTKRAAFPQRDQRRSKKIGVWAF